MFIDVIASAPRFAPVLLMFICLTGCGDSKYVSVTGTVTLDGEPLPSAFVEFTPQVPGGSMAHGRTDVNGEYYLMFSMNQKGAIPGENIVRISTADVGDVGEENTPERVPTRYNEETELRVNVEPGRANVIDFDLTADEREIIQPRYDN